ncbi:hypothetical protein TrRE_jg1265 [Triparma retinervis]|uniref:Uncharacterized protein n=1 Tax=Triparma retinervis TaxID=2557542 RepID=A0A9W6ZM08_9STRA|nr:hypothetical protein TrRE_jg1265 [Triparma retinervis]
MREAMAQVKKLNRRIAALEARLREALEGEEEERRNMVPRVIMGWGNRLMMGGFNKWKKAAEGMARGDAVSLYRGAVVKGTLKGLLRKYLRGAFDAMRGEGGRGRENTRETGRDEYETFGGNLTWTEVPLGSFVG